MTVRAGELSELRRWASSRRHAGHVHHHGSRLVTRRQVLTGALAGAGVAAAGSVLRPAWADHLSTTALAGADPRPIPGGVGPFHLYAPAYKPESDTGLDPSAVYEQSTITDFRGHFASTDVQGWGTDHTGRELYFRCDMRFMEGEYVAADGLTRRGSFGFI